MSIVMRYKCNSCDKLYIKEIDAINCCRPVSVYYCTSCKRWAYFKGALENFNCKCKKE